MNIKDYLSSRDISESYINYLIKALSKKNSKSKAAIDKYRKVFANNRNVAGFSEDWKEMVYTLLVDKADGAYIEDIDNNKYLDVTMGFGVHLFGHKPENIQNAIKSELEKGMPLGPLTEKSAVVAELIHELTGVDRCAFFNSGTEAVMVALRLARAETGRDKVVVFSGAYHGTYDSVLIYKKDVATQQGLPLIPGITENALKDVFYLDYGTEESLEFIEANADTIAAVLTEPVQSRNPSLQPHSYLKQLRKLTEDKDIALIFDEVITGFRIARGGAQEYFGIQADIVTYGKVMGGGMPIGVVAGKSKYLDYIDGGQWRFGDKTKPTSKTTFVAGTFCHHPLAMAAAKETLLTIKKSGYEQFQSLNQRTSELCEELNLFFRDNHLSVEMVHFGSLFRFQLKGFSRILFYQLLLEGVYIWEGRNCFLSTAHTDKDIKFLIDAVKRSCHILMAAGILKPGFGGKKLAMPQQQLRTWNSFSAPVNSLSAVIDLDGNFNIDYFYLSVNSVVQRHSMLKTYAVENGMIITKFNYEPSIYFKDFSFYADPECDSLDWNNEQRNKFFKNRPEKTFYFLSIAKLSATKCRIYLNVHKLVMDGWSMIIMLQEISTFYNAFVCNEHVKINEVGSFEKYLKKIQPELLNNKPIEILPIHYSPANVVERTLNETLVNNLKEVSKKKGRTMFQLLSALLIKVLWDERKDEMVIGVPVAGQLLTRQMGVIGPCTQIVPVTLSSLSDKNFAEILLDFDLSLNKAIKDFDLYYCQEKLNNSNVIINLDKVKETFRFNGLYQKVSIPEEEFTSYEMVWNILDKGNIIDLSLKYNREKFKDNGVDGIMDKFILYLENFLSMEYEIV